MPTKIKQSATQKIPKLRFAGFCGGWEEKRLGEVASFWNGKAHEKDISENGKYVVVNSKFVSSDGKVKKYSDKQISPLEEDDIAVVMSDIPKGKAIGKCFLIDKNQSYTLNQRIGGIKSKEIINPFLFHILNRNKYFLKFDNGVSQTNLRKNEILRCPVNFPLLSEQQKIAEFLGAVDEWIENLWGQKENLESYKKGMMQKIFSQEVRFKDDDGNDFAEWEEKRLGEVCEKESSGISANSLDDNCGEYKIYGANGKLKKVDFYQQNESYISIVKDGAGVGRILICEPKTSVLGTLDIIKPKEHVNLYFLYSLLSRIRFTKYTTGSTIPHIYFKDYKKEKIQIPNIEEQQKIAEFLTSIDNLINSKQQQITQAEEWKKGLMQGLFV